MADAETVRGRVGQSLPLLYDVREFVREQLLARRGRRVVCALTEVDVAPGGERVRVQSLRRAVGLSVVVHAHAAEVLIETRPHEVLRARVERLAARLFDGRRGRRVSARAVRLLS